MAHLGGRSTKTIEEGCREAKTLAHWAVAEGLGPEGAYAAAVLWAGLYSQDPRILNSVGGFDRLFASVVRDRARAMGIWAHPCTVGNNWGDEKDGEIRFLLDVCCITGRFVRTEKRGEEPEYDLASRSHRYRHLKPLPPVPHWWSIDRWPKPPRPPVLEPEEYELSRWEGDGGAGS